MPSKKHPQYRPAAEDVPWRLRDQVQLRAVLAPLTGHYRRKADIPPRVLAIRKRWRRAVGALRHRGWERVSEDKNRRRAALNCPMTFVLVVGKPRPCLLRTACPFCWARETANYWDRIDDAFFRDVRPVASPPGGQRAGRAVELEGVPAPAARPRKARAEAYTLVLRSRTFSFAPYKAREDGTRLDVLREFYLARTQGRSSLPDLEWLARRPEIQAMLKAIKQPGRRMGCFENVTADVNKARKWWRVVIRQVWLVPRGIDLPVIQVPQGVEYRERVFEAPWRSRVMRAVAWACRYPRAMLARELEGAAYQLVTARRGLRLAACYGDFRKKGGDT